MISNPPSWGFRRYFPPRPRRSPPISAKVGVENVNSHIPSPIRTIVILLASAAILLGTGQVAAPRIGLGAQLPLLRSRRGDGRLVGLLLARFEAWRRGARCA